MQFFSPRKQALIGIFISAFIVSLVITLWHKGIIQTNAQSKERRPTVLTNPLLDCDRKVSSNKPIANQTLRLSTGSPPVLIDPLFDCELINLKELPTPGPLKGKIVDTINQEKQKGNITDMAVYFRALRSGNWLGVNEDTTFSPASLLKVVLMLAYFRQAQDDPAILDDKFDYDQSTDFNASERTKPPYTLKKGQQYTIGDLVSRMVIDSDNNATYLLNKNIDEKSYNKVYTDVGLSAPDFSHEYTLSTKLYSVFFRVLFNATYLDRKYSQKALELLSSSTYKQGLLASLPQDLVVAHKFGERQVVDANNNDNGIKELHDCGIVYYPGHPYFLCVMTKGSDYTKLELVLAHISQLVYSEVNAYFVSLPNK